MTSSSIKIGIENVRRLEHAEFDFAPQSRTVIIGRNNAGKTTVLDMAARALWSLPGQFDSGWRMFHLSWYRRVGERFARPSVRVDLPAADLGAEVESHTIGRFHFELVGQNRETQVTRNVNGNTRLVTVRCNLTHQDGTNEVLLTPHGDLGSDALSDASLEASSLMFEDAPWTQPPGAPTRVDRRQTAANRFDRVHTPLSRGTLHLAKRVIYLPASRNPNFTPASNLTIFSQENQSDLSPLLAYMQTTMPARFDGLSSALSNLFPDARRLRLSPFDNGVVPEVEFNDGRSEYAGNLGFGFQSALHLLTVCSLCPPNAILFVDEPDRGLNQSCQRDLGLVLDDIRPDVTLVVATQAEAFCRGLSSETTVLLAEPDGDTSKISRLRISDSPDDLRRLARSMGLDPMFLTEGGKIIYVEGASDEEVVARWMRIHFPGKNERYQVVSLGGCGRLGEDFVRPILRAYRERVFVVLDSDRAGSHERMSAQIARLHRWLESASIKSYVLEKRELENYVGADFIAAAAGLHPSVLRAPPGHEAYHDIKQAFRRAKGFAYEERRLTIEAFDRLTEDAQRNLFGGETEPLTGLLRSFIDT